MTPTPHEQQAYYFPSSRAAGLPARASFSEQGIEIQLDGDVHRYAAADIHTLPPVQNVDAVFRLADGSLLECPASSPASDYLTFFSKGGRSNRLSSWAHPLEKSWLAAFSLLGLAILAAAMVFRFGVPVLSEWAAYRFPPVISQEAGDTLLQVLDNGAFRETELSPSRQTQLRALFSEAVAAHEPDAFILPPKLVFRGGGEIGANALAFPNGVVVMTDELISFAPSDQALQGVMAHELGHLVHLHGMQMAVSATAIPVLLSMLSGDLVSSTLLTSSLPVVLLSTGYSREFEREADRHAKHLFRQLKLSTDPIADFFEALQQETNGADDQLTRSIFSTHPGYDERISFFRE